VGYSIPRFEAVEPRLLLSAYQLLADNCLDIGNTAQYDGTLTTSSSVKVNIPFVAYRTITGTQIVGGQETYLRQTHIQVGAEHVYEDDNLVLTQDAILLYKYVRTSDADTETQTVRGADPLELLPRTINPGASIPAFGHGLFDASDKTGAWQETDTSAVTFLGVENVRLTLGATTQTVAAMKVKMHITDVYSDGGSGYIEEVYWLNPDYGIIKGTYVSAENGKVDTAYNYILHSYSLANPLPPRTVSIDDVQVTEPASGTSKAVFTVALSNAVMVPVTVSYCTAGGSATAGADFTTTSGKLTIPPGQIGGTISVPIRADSLVEGAETFSVNLTAATGADIADGVGQGTIQDPPLVSISSLPDPQAAETAPGDPADTGIFRISRSVTVGDLRVSFTRSGKATFGPKSDYTLSVDGTNLTGTSVVIPDGQASVDIIVAPVDDAPAEPAETVILKLSSSAAYTLDADPAKRTATVDILDNEPILTISSGADNQAAETVLGGGADTGVITISRNTTRGALLVSFTRSGTATFGKDYTLSGSGLGAAGTSVTIADGQDHVDITVTPIDDLLVEKAETVILKLSSSAAYTLDADSAKRTATVDILDNEPILTISSGADNQAAETVLGQAADMGVITISRNTTRGALLVSFTRSGTATFGKDYTLSGSGLGTAGTSVTIADGQDHADITVTPIDDLLVEKAETVILTLAAKTTYTLPLLTAERSATVTLLDNDTTSIFALACDAFGKNQPIPYEYTFAGGNSIPPLNWSNAPGTTKQFALIVDDSDAGGFVHWLLYNIPTAATSLVGGIPAGAAEGINSMFGLGYFGPEPPPGKVHHYHFKLYALDAELNLAAGLTKPQLLSKMTGHILGMRELVGTYLAPG
jgi:Raf kinase inhibitor-like YbhB/YbcL family protein